MSAIAGIDQALWDIKGKRYGVPIYQLLGGACRDRVRVYSWIGGDRPADVAASAAGMKAAGYTAVKMNATEEMHVVDTHAKIDAVAERVASVRATVGNDYGIGIDFHGRVHRPMARALARALEPFHPMFIEEPVLVENNEALRELSALTSIPIATGERMYSRWDFKRLLRDGYVDIVQPDPSHAGGISEVVKIAAMAEAHDVALAPHCPLGPIALAAALQIDAVSPNAFIQEQSLGLHYHDGAEALDYVLNKEVFEFRDGFAALPTKPGLGVEIDEEAVRSAAQRGHAWHNPLWRNPDGTVAEW